MAAILAAVLAFAPQLLHPMPASSSCRSPPARCAILDPQLITTAAEAATAIAATNPVDAATSAATVVGTNPNFLSLAGAAAIGAIYGAWPRGAIGAPYAADAKAYDPIAANSYYLGRLPAVAARLARLAVLTTGFNARLGLDYFAYKRAGAPEDESWPNEKERAKEALDLATQLGPTFIKLAQALSIRTDLIPEAYALELRELQDAVPSFDNDQARSILANELGLKDASELSTIFTALSPAPLAAASIGQVYKGRLHDGRTVAVKVQRPNILDQIALDLYLLRILTPLQTRISNAVNKIPTYPEDIDLAEALVDEWGRGFVAETDYLFEAANTKGFVEAMARRGLNAVTSPTVVDDLSSRRVLVTEWVDGTRLDLDASPDVPRLCGVAINAYLTMLLDTGVLHCDPHPGNLLRTTDGKLCILDWGMTQSVPSDLQYALIEFIAHVNAEDYEAMPDDFVNLGFTPPEQLERVRSSNLTEGLSFVLRQLSQGGGGKKLQERVRADWREQYDPNGELSLDELRQKVRDDFTANAREQLSSELGEEAVNVMDVQNVMENMQQRNREMFKVPPYILYVARAFSTLEGIGLSANDDYSIVSEAFPYLSKRLLTDDSPRAQAALRSMVYGGSDKDAANASPDFTKFLSMGEGMASYASSTSAAEPADASAHAQPAPASAAGGGATADSARAAAAAQPAGGGSMGGDGGDAGDALVDLLLTADGSYVQELLLEEAAKLADAAVRDSIAQAGESPPASALRDALRAPKRLAESTIANLPLPGPLKEAALAPANMLDQMSRVLPALAKADDTDAKTLSAFGALWDELEPRLSGGGDATDGEGVADGTPSGSNAPSPPSSATSLPPFVQTVQTNAAPLLEQLADPSSRLRHRLPLLGTLSRRFGVKLLRRVAGRLESDAGSPDAPGIAKPLAERAAEIDRGLADILEPESPPPAAAASGRD